MNCRRCTYLGAYRLPPETDFRAGTTFEEHDETIGYHTIGNRL